MKRLTVPGLLIYLCMFVYAPFLSAQVAKPDGTVTTVASTDLALTTTSCTNQFVTALSSSAIGTCTTATLTSAQFVNQGTTTTVLHGNAAGNPSFGAGSLTADVSGILPGANGGTNNAFFQVSGPTTALKSFTFPDA